jgi:predicted transcriptional regulator
MSEMLRIGIKQNDFSTDLPPNVNGNTQITLQYKAQEKSFTLSELQSKLKTAGIDLTLKQIVALDKISIEDGLNVNKDQSILEAVVACVVDSGLIPTNPKSKDILDSLFGKTSIFKNKQASSPNQSKSFKGNGLSNIRKALEDANPQFTNFDKSVPAYQSSKDFSAYQTWLGVAGTEPAKSPAVMPVVAAGTTSPITTKAQLFAGKNYSAEDQKKIIEYLVAKGIITVTGEDITWVGYSTINDTNKTKLASHYGKDLTEFKSKFIDNLPDIQDYYAVRIGEKDLSTVIEKCLTHKGDFKAYDRSEALKYTITLSGKDDVTPWDGTKPPKDFDKLKELKFSFKDSTNSEKVISDPKPAELKKAWGNYMGLHGTTASWTDFLKIYAYVNHAFQNAAPGSSGTAPTDAEGKSQPGSSGASATTIEEAKERLKGSKFNINDNGEIMTTVPSKKKGQKGGQVIVAHLTRDGLKNSGSDLNLSSEAAECLGYERFKQGKQATPVDRSNKQAKKEEKPVARGNKPRPAQQQVEVKARVAPEPIQQKPAGSLTQDAKDITGG